MIPADAHPKIRQSITQNGNRTQTVSAPAWRDSSYSFSLGTPGKAIYLLAAGGIHRASEAQVEQECLSTQHSHFQAGLDGCRGKGSGDGP